MSTSLVGPGILGKRQFHTPDRLNSINKPLSCMQNDCDQSVVPPHLIWGFDILVLIIPRAVAHPLRSAQEHLAAKRDVCIIYIGKLH